MADLVFSKQTKKRQKFFPWLKIFQRKLLRNFSRDLDSNILQFLLQNLKIEVTSLPSSGKTKRKKALFEIIYDLFLHFWWRIHWKGKKKWSRCWKKVSSDISYTKDERTKCCEKLLYYIIHLGITLSQGLLDSEWIGKVLQAIQILPTFDSMVYNSLLQVKKLRSKYHPAYNAILKHVLCTEVVVNLTEPAEYIKVMLLFRRLKSFTNDGHAISALKSIASRIKPPSGTIQWISSHTIDFTLEKHESITDEFLNRKSKYLFHKLYDVVSAPVDSEQKIHTQLCLNEEFEQLDNEAKSKKCKHKKKLHSKRKLKDSQINLCGDETPDCLNTPMEESTSSNCKMQANPTISKNSKVVSAPVDSKQKIHTRLCLNEEFEQLNNEAKSKKCKHKKKLHSKRKLKDSQINLCGDETPDCLNTPMEESTSSNCKMQANPTISKNSKVVSAPVDSEQKIHTQLCLNEEFEQLNNEAKSKKCKHKKKLHSKRKLKDSQINLCGDETPDCLNTTMEESTSSNCKMQANPTISKNSKKRKNSEKKKCSKTRNFLDDKCNKSNAIVETKTMNEFLNSSFAEISSSSKKVMSHKQNIQHASKIDNEMETRILKNRSIPEESSVISNITSNSIEDHELEKSFSGPSSHKKIKLDSSEESQQKTQFIQKLNLEGSIKTASLNSLVTLSSNEKSPPSTDISENACARKSTAVEDKGISSTQCLLPVFSRCISNGNLSVTSENLKSSSQKQTIQTSPDKIQFVSSADIQKTDSSASLKIAQLPIENSDSRLWEASPNENMNSNQIPVNTDNLSKTPASSSSIILRAPRKLKIASGGLPKVIPESKNTSKISVDSETAVASTESIDGMPFYKHVNGNVCTNGEINFNYPSSSNSTYLSNSLMHSTSLVGNKLNTNPSLLINGLFDNHRLEGNQPMISNINKSLEPSQNCLINYAKNSHMNSESTHESSSETSRTENIFGNVSVLQNGIPSDCVVECNIVNDNDTNKTQHESVTTFKLVINVTCKTPEDPPKPKNEHIFGTFNDAPENDFDSSLNLFPTRTPTPEMPKLTPYYNDLPIQAIDAIATPPDSELNTSIPTSCNKQGDAETLIESWLEKSQNKPNYSSTPKGAPATLPRLMSRDSDFRTPQTSDCETFSECDDNLANSPVTRSSIVKSPVDSILKRLNYRINLPPDKSKSHNGITTQNASKENVPYRSVTDVYSCEEESEDSTNNTVSPISATDDELNKNTAGQKVSLLKDASYSLSNSILTDESNIKALDGYEQIPLKVMQKRKNFAPEKFLEESQTNLKDLQEKSSCNITCGYNLRPRERLNKPSSFEDFF